MIVVAPLSLTCRMLPINCVKCSSLKTMKITTRGEAEKVTYLESFHPHRSSKVDRGGIQHLNRLLRGCLLLTRTLMLCSWRHKDQRLCPERKDFLYFQGTWRSFYIPLGTKGSVSPGSVRA